MKTLILIRHAKSSWADPDLDDYDRPLNKRGERDAPFIGQLLHKKKLLPDTILSSPTRRAKDTAFHIADALAFSRERIIYNERIYEAHTRQLLDIIQNTDDNVRHLILVGHNPAISRLANLVVGQVSMDMPTCAVHWSELPVTQWKQIKPGCGRLKYFEYPKKYRTDL